MFDTEDPVPAHVPFDEMLEYLKGLEPLDAGNIRSLGVLPTEELISMAAKASTSKHKKFVLAALMFQAANKFQQLAGMEGIRTAMEDIRKLAEAGMEGSAAGEQLREEVLLECHCCGCNVGAECVAELQYGERE